jgi:hypothetical protein
MKGEHPLRQAERVREGHNDHLPDHVAPPVGFGEAAQEVVSHKHRRRLIGMERRLNIHFEPRTRRVSEPVNMEASDGAEAGGRERDGLEAMHLGVRRRLGERSLI